MADQTWAIFWQRYNDGKIKLMALLILVRMSLIHTHTSIPTLTHSLAHSGSVLHAHTHASTSHPPIHTHAPKDRAQLRSRIPHVWSFVESYLAALLKFKTQPQTCHEIQFLKNDWLLEFENLLRIPPLIWRLTELRWCWKKWITACWSWSICLLNFFNS